MEASYQNMGALGAKAKAPKAPKAPKAKAAKPAVTRLPPAIKVPKTKTQLKAIPDPNHIDRPRPIFVDNDPAPPSRLQPINITVPGVPQSIVLQHPGQPGQGKYSKTLDLIGAGLQTFRDVKDGTLKTAITPDTDPVSRVSREAGGVGREAGGVGREAGGAVGSIFDGASRFVQRNPLATLAGLAALGLYFVQPKGGGYSRR